MRRTTRPVRRATATKVVASVALLAGAASVAGLGTFGAFTDTTTADQTVATGTIDLSGPEGALSAAVSGLVPGDWIERPVTLTRDAKSATFGSLTLTTSVSEVKGAVSQLANLPELTVDACARAWTPVPGTTQLSCSQGLVEGVAEGPVVGTFDLGKPLVDALNDDAVSTAYLRVSLKLPETAGNDFKNASAKVTFTFDVTQRAGKAV